MSTVEQFHPHSPVHGVSATPTCTPLRATWRGDLPALDMYLCGNDVESDAPFNLRLKNYHLQVNRLGADRLRLLFMRINSTHVGDIQAIDIDEVGDDFRIWYAQHMYDRVIVSYRPDKAQENRYVLFYIHPLKNEDTATQSDVVVASTPVTTAHDFYQVGFSVPLAFQLRSDDGFPVHTSPYTTRTVFSEKDGLEFAAKTFEHFHTLYTWAVTGTEPTLHHDNKWLPVWRDEIYKHGLRPYMLSICRDVSDLNLERGNDLTPAHFKGEAELLDAVGDAHDLTVTWELHLLTVFKPAVG